MWTGESQLWWVGAYNCDSFVPTQTSEAIQASWSSE